MSKKIKYLDEFSSIALETTEWALRLLGKIFDLTRLSRSAAMSGLSSLYWQYNILSRSLLEGLTSFKTGCLDPKVLKRQFVSLAWRTKATPGNVFLRCGR